MVNKNPKLFLEKVKKYPEDYWIQRGKKMAWQLFKQMSQKVPAYKKFLQQNKIKNINSIKDFNLIPTIDKNNYLRKYSFTQLSWKGDFKNINWTISLTSGSAGKPFYFPRTNEQDKQYAFTAEMYLRENYQIHKKSTLYINTFALGVWIGGLFTYDAIKIINNKKEYKLSIINPGLNKEEIIKALKKMSPLFDQTILAGYPPFVKDIIDEAKIEKVALSRLNIKFIFSAEAFSEKFRDYIFKKTGKHNIYLDSLNHYGTVDQGTLANETSLSILIRRLALTKKKLCESIFGEINKVPTLAQYLPEMFYFEQNNGELLCSSYSGLPLIRYDLKDYGGILKLSELKQKFSDFGIDLNKKIKEVKIEKHIWNLPFVYVYERKDSSVSLRGANIYPETIKRVLIEKKFQPYFAGKFTLLVKNDKQLNPYLEINIELKKDTFLIQKKLKKELQRQIVNRLLKENSEYYSVYYEQKNGKALPKLKFWPYESQTYFKKTGKQKWIIKN